MFYSLLPILSVSSFLMSLLAVSFIKQRFSQQLLDIPNDRSSHTQPTPRGGGVGFIIAFAFTSAIASVLLPVCPSLIPLWLAAIPLAIIGILDDRQGVPSGIRYLVQLSAAAIATAYLGAFPQPWLANFGFVGMIVGTVLTVIGITAIINFYNFMDGLDGLVAGCVAVQLGFLALYLNQPILWLLVAAIGGFLYWNWSPAKIFMGDAGSTVLGAIVAISLLSGPVASAWTALAITLPLTADAIYTLVRRVLRRENIFQAHRSHIFQRLQQASWTHAQVAIAYIGFNCLIALGIAYLGATGAWLSLGATILAILGSEVYLQSRPLQEA